MFWTAEIMLKTQDETQVLLPIRLIKVWIDERMISNFLTDYGVE